MSPLHLILRFRQRVHWEWSGLSRCRVWMGNAHGHADALSRGLSVRCSDFSLMNQRSARMATWILRTIAASMVMPIMIVRFVAVIIVVGHAPILSAVERIEVAALMVCLGHPSCCDQDPIPADTSEVAKTSAEPQMAGDASKVPGQSFKDRTACV